MTTRTRFTAEYLYPGSFMPEETSRALTEPTLEAAITAGPDEDGYFRKDGWYAVLIRSITEKRYVADDNNGEAWIRQGDPTVRRIIIGERIHHEDDRIAGDEHTILRANLRANDRSGGYGVLTRCGNWQIASDYDEIVAPEQVTA